MTVQEIKGKKLVKGIAPNVEPEALLNDKRKVFLFGSPSYTNIGDQAIAYAEEKFIKNHFPYYEYIEIMDYATDEGIELVKEIIREDDIVCFTGGGNLGNLYLDIEEDRRKVFRRLKTTNQFLCHNPFILRIQRKDRRKRKKHRMRTIKIQT
ncbi:General stress protein 30 [Bacillus subtilis]|nr:General stress protein 30 [Bacillus subtilis]